MIIKKECNKLNYIPKNSTLSLEFDCHADALLNSFILKGKLNTSPAQLANISFGTCNFFLFSYKPGDKTMTEASKLKHSSNTDIHPKMQFRF